MKIKVKNEIKPILYLNFQPFYLSGLIILIILSPLMRGLFFRQDILMAMMLIAVTFLFCLGDQLLRKDILTFYQPLDWAMLGLIAAYALSLITAVHIGSAVQSLMVVISYFMIYWIGSRVAGSNKTRNLILTVIYITGIIVSLIGLGQAIGLLNYPGGFENGVINATLQYRNSLAIYLVAINIIGLGFSIKTENLLIKILYAIANTILVMVILGTQSRGGWIIYPFALGAYIMLTPYVYRWRAIYHMIIFLSTGLIGSRLYYSQVQSENVVQALTMFVVIIVITALLQFFYHLIAIWFNRDEVEESTRRLVGTGGIVYLLTVGILYAYYASSALVAVAPTQVTNRIQTISGTDVSFQARLEFYKDAFKIIKDYPLIGAGGGGWNALYHQYASHLYWTTEAHNYFLQTWLEAGTIGFLALIGVWFLLIRCLMKFIHRETEETEQIIVWSMAVAVFAIILHSIIDFDMSMLSIGIFVYLILGMLRTNTVNDEKPLLDQKKTTKWLIPVICTIFAVFMVFIPHRFYTGLTYGSHAAAAISAKKISAASTGYSQAIKLDPLTASYYSDLAQIMAINAINNDDALARYQVIKLGKKAASLEPFNLEIRSSLLNTYNFLGERQLLLKEADALVKANPLDETIQITAARARIDVALYYFHQGNSKLALRLVDKMLSMQRQRSNLGSEQRVSSLLCMGQANILKGNLDQGRSILTPIAAGNSKASTEAKLWLLASEPKQVSMEQLNSIFDKVPQKQRDSLLNTYKSLQDVLH